ncbi:MAG TPA: carboxypeptidase-like regulatory domain-containing protein, partial [Candidatus Syntrophosphaera thermopropionivorans]|nr:carboxypeptidase-like regulatory domain-containing protein [Candidatus Syntrophosphaera thermopropionivorans]
MQKKILLMVLIIFLCGILHCATISGFVSRADSGEPIQYVNVYIADTKIGCQTNKKGYYVLNLQQTGDFILTFSLVSYKKETVPITIKNLNDHLVINMQLVKSSVELSPVIVKGTKDESDGPIIQPSTLHQTRQDIQMVVAPMEADVFRAVLAVPGVVPISDFFAGLYVRGGSP